MCSIAFAMNQTTDHDSVVAHTSLSLPYFQRMYFYVLDVIRVEGDNGDARFVMSSVNIVSDNWVTRQCG